MDTKWIPNSRIHVFWNTKLVGRSVTEAQMSKFSVSEKSYSIFEFSIFVLVGIMNSVAFTVFYSPFLKICGSGYQVRNISESTIFAVCSMSIKCEYHTNLYHKQPESKWIDILAFLHIIETCARGAFIKKYDQTTTLLRYWWTLAQVDTKWIPKTVVGIYFMNITRKGVKRCFWFEDMR